MQYNSHVISQPVVAALACAVAAVADAPPLARAVVARSLPASLVRQPSLVVLRLAASRPIVDDAPACAPPPVLLPVAHLETKEESRLVANESAACGRECCVAVEPVVEGEESTRGDRVEWMMKEVVEEP